MMIVSPGPCCFRGFPLGDQGSASAAGLPVASCSGEVGQDGVHTVIHGAGTRDAGQGGVPGLWCRGLRQRKPLPRDSRGQLHGWERLHRSKLPGRSSSPRHR